MVRKYSAMSRTINYKEVTMERTLYLNEKKGLEILRDGPSIWIREDGKSGRRIPARLIGRVIVIGNVKMDAGSITLFTDNNVPITFMNRRGEEVAVTLPYNHTLNSHYEEQKTLIETEENTDRFKRLLMAERRKLQLNVIKKLSRDNASNFAEKGFRERDYQEFIFRHLLVDSKKSQPVNEVIYNLYSEAVLRSIMKADLDPHIGVLHRRHNYALVFDICHAIEADIDLQVIHFFKFNQKKGYLFYDVDNWSIAREGLRDIIHRFENRKKIIHEYIEKILDGLFELMRELRT